MDIEGLNGCCAFQGIRALQHSGALAFEQGQSFGEAKKYRRSAY